MFGLKTLERRAKVMILMALTGGVGAGGYLYSDHPVFRQILGKVRKEVDNPDMTTAEIEAKVEEKAKAALKTIVGGLSTGIAPDRTPGTFEVTVAEVRIDPKEFHLGPLAELEVRVVRHGAREGDDHLVWQGEAKAERARDDAGATTLTASWADRPFRVEWRVGDDYTVEVRDRRALGLAGSTWFSLDLEDDGSFPLRSKTHRLDTRADGKPARDPGVNALVLKSQRINSSAKSHENPVAESPSDRRAIRR
jgi:hypothetical protein